MKVIHSFIFIWIFLFCLQNARGQTTTTISVDASISLGNINPLWQDQYELHLIFGWGGNPYFNGPHQQYIDNPGFASEMGHLNPRYIRVSSGRFENPPDSIYFSTNTRTLKNIWTEFYKGPVTLAGANDISNYYFSYVDSLSDVVHSVGAEPFFDLAYMPFVLSADTTPNYIGTIPLTHLYSWDNSIRNSPPSNNAVYGRVIYQLIKHLHLQKGVRYFELWNEPDQFPLNTFFWKGNSTQLYDMYSSVVNEIESDTMLAPNIKIGCCGFALNSSANLFPLSFLTNIQNNSTRMDFISFHPYSSAQMGGYDSASVDLVESWKNTYVPDAELINSEWGILSSGFGSAGWSDLDYGLEKTKAFIHMNTRNIKMAHQAVLADIDNTTTTCCLGQYYVDPAFAPKPSAFVNYNLNKLLKTPVRIYSQATNGNFVLAGKNSTGDSLTIVFPADNPNGTNTVILAIQNLSWNNGIAKRYELTENSFAANQIFNLVDSFEITNNSFFDTLIYPSLGNSGRLVVWELSRSIINSFDKTILQNMLTVFPNPANGRVQIEVEKDLRDFELTLTDAIGRQVADHRDLVDHNSIEIFLPDPGIFFIILRTKDIVLRKKIVNCR
jgi:hypothetical protein